jgi:hypothetical protein
MDDAFETLLVAWLAFAFLPERPTRSQGGTDGSNPLSSSRESTNHRFLPDFIPLGSGQAADASSRAVGEAG